MLAAHDTIYNIFTAASASASASAPVVSLCSSLIFLCCLHVPQRMPWDVRGWPLNHPRGWGGVQSHAALAQNSIFNFKVHQSQCTWEQEPWGQTWGWEKRRKCRRRKEPSGANPSKTSIIRKRLARCNCPLAIYLKSQVKGGSKKFGLLFIID